MITYLTSGESHGPGLTAILDGFPAGFPINIDQINFQLERRQKGYGRGGRMKIEKDRVQILSGIRNGYTMGGPVTFHIANQDWKNWKKIMDPVKPISNDLTEKEKRLAFENTRPRPGHSDLPGGVKWNHHDLRNVLERASARETAARVALGAFVRQLLEYFDVEFASHVIRIGEVALPEGYDISDLDKVRTITEESEVRCLDKETGNKMIEAIKKAKKLKDSLGGIVEVIVRGLPIGLGGFSQWSDRLEGKLAGALMSVHSVKGVDIGMGFDSAHKYGSEVHDQIYYDKKGNLKKKKFYRKTNNAGGLEAGITNGEDIIIHVAGKPISTLNQPLATVDIETKKPAVAIVERTDCCVTPPLAVVCEAVSALVLTEAFLNKFGSDNFAEIERNYNSFLNTEY
ncbi:MAG: chorismate synthase [bacterium]